MSERTGSQGQPKQISAITELGSTVDRVGYRRRYNRCLWCLVKPAIEAVFGENNVPESEKATQMERIQAVLGNEDDDFQGQNALLGVKQRIVDVLSQIGVLSPLITIDGLDQAYRVGLQGVPEPLGTRIEIIASGLAKTLQGSLEGLPPNTDWILRRGRIQYND